MNGSVGTMKSNGTVEVPDRQQHEYTNGSAKNDISAVGTKIPSEILETNLMVEKLSTQDMEALRACFDSDARTVFSYTLRDEVTSRLLPRVAARMGWTEGATCRKLRANDARSVSIRYNSDYHRDRHLYGSAPQGSHERREAAWSNVSAVIYLDPASFSYIANSAWSNPSPKELSQSESYVDRDFEAGTMIMFPSSLIHKAKEGTVKTDRRTIIAFDIEDASPKAKRWNHAVIRMPPFFQVPWIHMYFLNAEQVKAFALYWLSSDYPYGWRFMPKWCRGVNLCRVHWQVTTPKELSQQNSATGELALNSSIYMPLPKNMNHVHFYDYHGFFGYVMRLVDAYTFRFYQTR